MAVIKITYKHNHTNHNTSSVLSLFYSGTTIGIATQMLHLLPYVVTLYIFVFYEVTFMLCYVSFYTHITLYSRCPISGSAFFKKASYHVHKIYFCAMHYFYFQNTESECWTTVCDVFVQKYYNVFVMKLLTVVLSTVIVTSSWLVYH